MQEVVEALEAGDIERQKYAEKMVDYFTQQLNEANPILTAISDAMTDEGRILEAIEKAVLAESSSDEITALRTQLDEASMRKQQGNQDLMECSARYNTLMKALREERATK